MKIQLFVVAALTATTLAVSQFGCSKSSSGGPTATPSPIGSPVSFAKDVFPIIASGTSVCNSQGCHGSGVGNNPPVLVGTTAAVYAVVNASPIVVTGAPATSKLACSPLALPEGCTPQCSSDPFTTTSTPDYVTILTWIQQGALNN